VKIKKEISSVKRDPYYKLLLDIRKSGAAGAHTNKKKIIPRKSKYDKSEINQLQ